MAEITKSGFTFNKEYKITRVYNGNGAKGDFSFVTIENKKENSKYASRCTICVWGSNVDCSQNDGLIILNGFFDMKYSKDQSGKERFELQCTCEVSDLKIVYSYMQRATTNDASTPQLTELPQSEDDNLPF